MSNRRIKRIGLQHELVEVLSQHKLTTCKDVLSMSEIELLHVTGLCYKDVRNIIQVVSKAVSPEACTAASLLNPTILWCPRYLSTTLSYLDVALHGGLRSSTLTEIVGPPGCGKTQFAIMLSILAALPTEMAGLNASVIYIDTEAAFSAERLIEMARCKFPTYFCNEERLAELSSRILVSLQLETNSLTDRLNYLEEDIINKDAKLVIVDSIASPVRKEYDRASIIQRGQVLSKQGGILKYIAEAFAIPVVVTNQITTSYNQRSSLSLNDEDLLNAEAENINTGSSIIEESGPQLVAALGETWAHSVNTRLFMSRIDETRRKITIMKSPIAACESFNYVIESNGLVMA